MSHQLRKPNCLRSLNPNPTDKSCILQSQATPLLLANHRSPQPTSTKTPPPPSSWCFRRFSLAWRHQSLNHSPSFTKRISVCCHLQPRPPQLLRRPFPLSASPAETHAWPGSALVWLSVILRQKNPPTTQQRRSPQWKWQPRHHCQCHQLHHLQWLFPNLPKQGALCLYYYYSTLRYDLMCA